MRIGALAASSVFYQVIHVLRVESVEPPRYGKHFVERRRGFLAEGVGLIISEETIAALIHEHEHRQAGTWTPEAQSVTSTICPYCGVGCTLDLLVQDNEIVRVTSPADSSVTGGHLCVKGRFGFSFVSGRRGA